MIWISSLKDLHLAPRVWVSCLSSDRLNSITISALVSQWQKEQDSRLGITLRINLPAVMKQGCIVWWKYLICVRLFATSLIALSVSVLRRWCRVDNRTHDPTVSPIVQAICKSHATFWVAYDPCCNSDATKIDSFCNCVSFNVQRNLNANTFR
jgi:hypothetical protein